MEAINPEYINKADQYLNELCEELSNLSREPFVELANLIMSCYKNSRQIFVAGNGGSAATASHLVCDLQKTVLQKKYKFKKRIKAYNLTDNIPVVTAWANDYGYDHIFSEQLITLARPNDLLIVITGSGNSKNIINALTVAKDLGMKSFGLLGFDGGAAKELCDRCILAKKVHYGLVEDVHSITGHLVTELLISMYSSDND